MPSIERTHHTAWFRPRRTGISRLEAALIAVAVVCIMFAIWEAVT